MKWCDGQDRCSFFPGGFKATQISHKSGFFSTLSILFIFRCQGPCVGVVLCSRVITQRRWWPLPLTANCRCTATSLLLQTLRRLPFMITPPLLCRPKKGPKKLAENPGKWKWPAFFPDSLKKVSQLEKDTGRTVPAHPYGGRPVFSPLSDVF